MDADESLGVPRNLSNEQWAHVLTFSTFVSQFIFLNRITTFSSIVTGLTATNLQ
jgi:hypothetical protein